LYNITTQPKEIKWKDIEYTSPTGEADSTGAKVSELFGPIARKRPDLELVTS
jgi:hypothetical protein